MTTVRKLAAGVLVLGLIAGCGSDSDPASNDDTATTEAEPEATPIPDECDRLLRTADMARRADNAEHANKLATDALTECETLDNWNAGLDLYVDAAGRSKPLVTTRRLCTYEQREAPVCADAIDDGLFPTPAPTTTTTTTIDLATFPTTLQNEAKAQEALAQPCAPDGTRVAGPIDIGYIGEFYYGVVCHLGAWSIVVPVGYTCFRSLQLGDPAYVTEQLDLLQCIGGDLVYPDRPLDYILESGNYPVGNEPGQIQPGTWATERPVSDCYWERVDANGRTITNDFVTGAPTVRVTIAASDAGFNTDGCGSWVLEA